MHRPPPGLRSWSLRRPLRRAPALLRALAAGLPLLLVPGAPARGEDLPPQVLQALTLAAALPAPSRALGFQFHAQGERKDPASGQVQAQLELSLRVEPVTEGGLEGWKTTEVWSAKTATATSRRQVEATFSRDLTPLRGATYEDGTAHPVQVDWLGGERILAIQVRGKDRRVLRSAGYAGQAVVEVGGALLWARLLPKEFPRCQIDFLCPSWNKLGAEGPKAMGLALVGGEGPPIRVQSQNAPEVAEIRTTSIQGYRDAQTLVFSVLRHAETGLPILVMINGTTYAGDARPL